MGLPNRAFDDCVAQLKEDKWMLADRKATGEYLKLGELPYDHFTTGFGIGLRAAIAHLGRAVVQNGTAPRTPKLTAGDVATLVANMVTVLDSLAPELADTFALNREIGRIQERGSASETKTLVITP